MQNRYIHNNKPPAESESEDFKQFYQAAKKRDEIKIKQLVEQGACVDERSGPWPSAAVKLNDEGDQVAVALLKKHGANRYLIEVAKAEKNIKDIEYCIKVGDFEAAEDLRINHNQDVNKSAFYAALNGYFEYADHLHKHFNADLVSIALGAAYGGYTSQSQKYRIEGGIYRQEDLENIAEHIVNGGHIKHAKAFHIIFPKLDVNVFACAAMVSRHFDYAEELYRDHKADPELMMLAAIQKKVFDGEEMALYHFTQICNGKFRQALVNIGLDQYYDNKTAEDMKKLAYKATKLRHFMSDYNLNYDQALAWYRPEFQEWVLKGPELFGKKGEKQLDPHFEVMAKQSNLSFIDCQDLYHKVTLQLRKKCVKNDLQEYTKGNHFFNLFASRALKLKEKCLSAKNNTEFFENLVEVKESFDNPVENKQSADKTVETKKSLDKKPLLKKVIEKHLEKRFQFNN